MSTGLQLTREAPPLLGPSLPPFPPLVPGAGRCCAASPDSLHPVCRGKGRLGSSSRTGDAGERLGESRSRQVATWVRAHPSPGESVWQEADLGQHSGREGSRRAGGELPGEGRGGPFPGISGDQVTALTEGEPSQGRQALRRTGPLAPFCSSPRPHGGVPAHTDPVWRGRSTPPAALYGRDASASCRRVSTFSVIVGTIRPRGLLALGLRGTQVPGRDSSPSLGAEGSPRPSGRPRDAQARVIVGSPGPGDCLTSRGPRWS